MLRAYISTIVCTCSLIHHWAEYSAEMTPLRSKFSCDRWKSRRKKCDESKPICQNCHRLNFLCSYSTKQLDSVGEEEPSNILMFENHDFVHEVPCMRVPISTLDGLCIQSLKHRDCILSRQRTSTPRVDDEAQLCRSLVWHRNFWNDRRHLRGSTLEDNYNMVSSALTSFSGSILLSANVPNPPHPEEIVNKYQHTIKTLRTWVGVSQGSRVNIYMLSATILAGLVEVSLRQDWLVQFLTFAVLWIQWFQSSWTPFQGSIPNLLAGSTPLELVGHAINLYDTVIGCQTTCLFEIDSMLGSRDRTLLLRDES